MKYECTEERFLKDVDKHVMTIVCDDGVHRHVKFKQPDSYNMCFNIVTYPHHLVYSGDMGCYVFSRIDDMFQFFRGKEQGPLRINLSYWAEKLEATDRADGHHKYDPDAFRQYISERLDDMEADQELRDEVEESVTRFADDNEYEAREALSSFLHDGRALFQDTWEADFTDYTYRFRWCCYAISWAIRQYDAARLPETERSSPSCALQ